MTGAALGVATVALSALLPAWCGVWAGWVSARAWVMPLCNVPWVFNQGPVQAWIAAGFAWRQRVARPRGEWAGETSHGCFPVGGGALFTALVWMDSAAFFIIQHSAELKSGTWGDRMLWRNA